MDFVVGGWEYKAIPQAVIGYNGTFLKEEFVLKSFTSEVVDVLCGSNDETCASFVRDSVRSVKLASFYRSIHELDHSISEILKEQTWLQRIEGNVFTFFDKVKTLQEYADDVRVKTICEVGFNAGYSAMNFLISNPNASFVSFDIFDHDYTGPALRSLHTRFPTRDIALLAGDSVYSVASFARLFAQHKCNLIFIDGGHSREVFVADVLNFQKIADLNFNIVVVDDAEHGPVIEGWNALATDPTSGFVAVAEVRTEKMLGISWDVSTDRSRYEFSVRRHPEWISSLGIAKYVAVDDIPK